MIEEELQVYRRLQDADPFELQEKILRTIGYEEGEINSITAEAQDPLLTNCSLIELVERRMEKQLKLKAEDMMLRCATKNVVLPLWFSRPKCSKCKEDVYGVLAYTGGTYTGGTYTGGAYTGDNLYFDGKFVTEEQSTTYECFVSRIASTKFE